MTVAQIDRLALASGIAHGLAIASAIVLFLGACGVARSIGAPDRMAFAGIVVFGFACVAISMAATVSGFIVPGIMQRMARDAGAEMRTWQIVIDGIFQFNQAFARIYSITASVAVILWSAPTLRPHPGSIVFVCDQLPTARPCRSRPLLLLRKFVRRSADCNSSVDHRGCALGSSMGARDRQVQSAPALEKDYSQDGDARDLVAARSGYLGGSS